MHPNARPRNGIDARASPLDWSPHRCVGIAPTPPSSSPLRDSWPAQAFAPPLPLRHQLCCRQRPERVGAFTLGRVLDAPTCARANTSRNCRRPRPISSLACHSVAGPAPRPRPISRHSRGVRAARSSVTTHVSVTVPASRRYSPGPPTRMHADEPSVTAKLACVSRRGSFLQYLSRPCPPRQFPWPRHGEHIAIFGMRHTCRPGLCGPPKSRPRAYSRSVIPTARSLRTESRHAIGAMCLKLLRATSLLARCRQH